MCSFACQHNEFRFIVDDFRGVGVNRYSTVIWPVTSDPPVDPSILPPARANHSDMQAGSFTW
jgi:hypothetical protein